MTEHESLRENGDEPRMLLTVRDVCARLQLSRPTVYELINAGEVRAIRFGRVWRVPVRSVEEFIARRSGASV